MEKFQLPSEYDTEELRKLVELFPQFWKEGYFDFEEMKSYISGIVPDDLQEKYSFTWHGKTESYHLLKKNSNGTLRPFKDESVNWDTTQNLYIEGDNLEVLKLIKHTYAGKNGVKMIYIDPPYNSNEDFIYNDKFIDSLNKYLEYTNQKGIAMPEVSGRYHTRWLNMMYPRLWLANYLLRDDGVIFISIDDREVTNLRKLCDEVFGEENFIAQLVWEKKKKGSFLSNSITNIKEYILVYCKSLPKFKGLIGEINTNTETYPCVNASNKREIRTIPIGIISKYKEKNYFLASGSEISDTTMSIILHSDLVIKDGILAQELIVEGNWRYSQSAMTEYALKKELYITRDLYLRRIVTDAREKTLKDILPRVGNNISLQYNDKININDLFESGWGSNEDADEELRLLFGVQKLIDYPKPVKLLYKLIASNKVKDGIFLDFFSGSATTAHAVMQLNAEDGGNRHFICVQLPEACDEKSEAYKAGYKNICEIGKERIRRAGKKILEEWQKNQSQIKIEEQVEQSPPDIGFRVFKLDKSNFRTWDDTPIEHNESDKLIQQMELYANSPFVKGRSHEDIVYEVIRMNNYPLTTPILPIEINGKIVYGIGEDCDFIICLDIPIGEREAEELCKYRPGRILFTDSCFENTEIRVNVEHTIRNINAKIKLKVV